MSNNNPFQLETTLPLVALVGHRGGYIQLSPSTTVEGYEALPIRCLEAALAWASILEAQPTIARCYWITLSEAVRQVHIHLYPRYSDELEGLGIPLFEARNTLPQPPWTQALQEAFQQWAKSHAVAVLVV